MSIHYDFIEQNLRDEDPQLERFQIQQYLSKHRGKKKLIGDPKFLQKMNRGTVWTIATVSHTCSATFNSSMYGSDC
jgi:hypothetical protein